MDRGIRDYVAMYIHYAYVQSVTYNEIIMYLSMTQWRRRSIIGTTLVLQIFNKGRHPLNIHGYPLHTTR